MSTTQNVMKSSLKPAPLPVLVSDTMWSASVTFEVLQTAAAMAMCLCALAARFTQAETRRPNATTLIYFLCAILCLSMLILIAGTVQARGEPDTLRLLANLLYTFAIILQIDQLWPCTAKDEKEQKRNQNRHAFFGSCVFMSAFDILAIVERTLTGPSASSLLARDLSAPSLRLCLVFVLSALHGYTGTGRGGYIPLGEDIEGSTTTTVGAGQGSSRLAQEDSEPAALYQSIRAEIRLAGGRWPWMKKFWILRRWVWPEDMPWKWMKTQAIAAFVVKLCETVSRLIEPYLYANFLANSQQGPMNERFLTNMKFYALYKAFDFASSRGGLGDLRKLLWTRFQLHRAKRTKEAIYSHLMGHDAAFHQATNPIDINTAIEKGVNVSNSFDFLFFEALPQLLQLIVASITIFSWYGPRVWLVQNFSVALDIVVSLRMQKVVMPVYDEHETAHEETERQRQGGLRAWLTIALHGQTEREIEMHNACMDNENKLLWRSWVYNIVCRFGLGLMSCITNVVAMALFLLGSQSLEEGLSHVVLFQRYWKLLEDSLGFFITCPEDILNDLVKASRLRCLMETEPTVKYGTRELQLNGGELVFKGVSFAYGRRKDGQQKHLFKNLDLVLEAKKTTAIVGPTGVGKSTIIALLMGFWNLLGGKIECDGQDIRTLKKGELSKRFAVLEQTPQILGKTFYDDIRYSQPQASNEVVQEAAKKAGIHDEIMARAGQYDAVLGEQGRNLSGGQKQRVALARTLAHDPDVLLLDEPTSALDVESEDAVARSIKALGGKKTIVIVAHRLSMVRHADKIVVFGRSQDGCSEIAEMGTHEELLALGQQYAQMWKKHIGTI